MADAKITVNNHSAITPVECRNLIDPQLNPSYVYPQVPTFHGSDRGVIGSGPLPGGPAGYPGTQCG